MTTIFQPNAAKHSPLHHIHESLGAQFTNFGGFEMPVRYESDLKEHQAVRTSVGLFDVSHMGKIFIIGAGAADYLDYALAGRISSQAVGHAKYTLILDEAGGIIDDLLSYRLNEDSFMLVPNAGNQDTVFQELLNRSEKVAAFTGEITNGATDWGVLALQGPYSEEVLLAAAEVITLPETLPSYYRFVETTIQTASGPARLILARTGYTGEDGFEFIVETHGLETLWNALVADKSPGTIQVAPAGLAARDSLRLEAGFPLYGSELGIDVKPAEVGLGRIVEMTKNDFVGKSALKKNPGSRTLLALQGEGRRSARSGYPVQQDGTATGVITSGALSPTLGHPIAFALIQTTTENGAENGAGKDTTADLIGQTVQVDLRGKPQDYVVVKSPFYRRPQQ